MLRPTLLHRVCAALAIAASLGILCVFVAGCVDEPFYAFAGVIVVPCCLGVAALQYFGTFRRHMGSADGVGVVFFLFGAFATFVGVMSLGDAVMKGLSLTLTAPFVAIVATVAVINVAVGLMNWMWARRLRAAIAEGASPARRGWSWREAVGAAAVLAAMTGATAYMIRTTPPRMAEHVTAEEAPVGLPDGASDVSYRLGARGTRAYEFTVEEQAFRDWVQSGIGSVESLSDGVELEEIDSPFTPYRYLDFERGSADQLNGPRVSNGLHYGWSKEDRGIYVTFDRDTNRAYYFSHSH